MDHPRMEVKCHVSNCYYWKNNYCHADSIEVNPKNTPTGAPTSAAHTSDDALCTTFRPHNR